MHIVVAGKDDTSAATLDAIVRMQNGNVALVLAAEVADILAACKTVADPADPVTQIDIVGHGAPGYLSLADQGTEAISCTREDVLNLAKLVQVLSGAKPVLRLAGCNTALHGGSPGTDGPVLLTWLAHAMPGVRIVGTRCEFQSEAFGADGLQLAEEFFYSIVHGDAVETIPQPMVLPDELDSVTSPIDDAFRDAAVAGAQDSPVARWLTRARSQQCLDATRRLTAFREVLAFTNGRRSWRVGFTRTEPRLMIEDENGRRFLFPTVSIPDIELPLDDH
jgi:hypothetical protein